MIKKKYEISGMTCGHCVKAVEMELKDLDLESYDVEIGKADIKYDPEKVSEAQIIAAVKEAGYEVTN